MNLRAPAVLLASAALLLGAAAPAPPPAPPSAPTPAPSPAGLDYTTRMSRLPRPPERDPAQSPPPLPPLAARGSSVDGLQQCVGRDGVPVFTDRRCEDVDAVEQPARAAAPGALLSPGLLRVHSCARNQDDLLAGVRAALESHDANRLADFYHWTGVGSAEGYRLMERLDAFSARPVVDVQLVRSTAPVFDPYNDYYQFQPPGPAPDVFAEADPETGPAADQGTEPLATPTPAPPPSRQPRARLLRVEQMRTDKDPDSTTTYFHLLTNAGCWWMRF